MALKQGEYEMSGNFPWLSRFEGVPIKSAALMILENLIGYPRNSRRRETDLQTICDALTAWKVLNRKETYFLLAGDRYYPSGWEDYAGSFDDLELAKKSADKHCERSDTWAEIIEIESMSRVYLKKGKG